MGCEAAQHSETGHPRPVGPVPRRAGTGKKLPFRLDKGGSRC